jgi:hypothetical protein
MGRLILASEQHAQFCGFDGGRHESELAVTFSPPEDAERNLNLTVLAIDIPAEAS